MTLEDISKVLPLVAFLVLQGIDEALAEDCGNGIHCYSPYTCCSNVKSCCYDRDAQDNFRRSYKLHIWNMWYFWFVIIFIMMSCFGGCGYYRRRRMATLHQQRQRAPITTRRTNHIRSSSGNRTSQSYLAYVGPAASDPPEISFLPPPYSEVSSHPGMYPETKADLPPQYSVIAANYAGSPSPPMALNAQDLAAGTNNMPKPPPYSEVAEPVSNPVPPLAEASAAPTNQDTQQTPCEDSSTNQCSTQSPSANDSTVN